MSSSAAFIVAPDDPPSKRAILTAALTIFVRDGVRGSNIRTIAEAAGYTNPAIFKFFKTKDHLALYLFERCYLQCLGVMRAAVAPHAHFPAMLRAALAALAAFVEQHPEAFFFVQDNLRVYWPKLPKAARSGSIPGEFRTIIELGRREGYVSEAVPVELQLAAVIGFLSQLARMHFFRDFEPSITGQLDAIEAMILVMLQARVRER